MQLDPLLLWFLGELLLVSLVSATVLGVRGVLGRRRDRAAARSLIEQIKETVDDRAQETREILTQRYGIAGDSLEELVSAISREEKRFYQTLIDLYLKRDAEALQSLHLAFGVAVAPYRSLPIAQSQGATGSEADDVATAADDDAAELGRLRDENERLSEELRITMDTMGRMLSEYSSMFAGGEDGELDKEKMIAMFQSEGGVLGAALADTDGADREADDGEPAPDPDQPQAAAEAGEGEGLPASTDDGDGGAEAPGDAAAETGASDPESEGLMSLDDDLEQDLAPPEEAPVAQIQV